MLLSACMEASSLWPGCSFGMCLLFYSEELFAGVKGRGMKRVRDRLPSYDAGISRLFFSISLIIPVTLVGFPSHEFQHADVTEDGDKRSSRKTLTPPDPPPLKTNVSGRLARFLMPLNPQEVKEISASVSSNSCFNGITPERAVYLRAAPSGQVHVASRRVRCRTCRL